MTLLDRLLFSGESIPMRTTLGLIAAVLLTLTVVAQEPDTQAGQENSADQQPRAAKPDESPAQPGESPEVVKSDPRQPQPPAEVPDQVDTSGMVRLDAKRPVWLDRERRWIVTEGEVVLNRGMLEMFACPRGTKEHESIVAVDCRAMTVHAGLIAIGVKPGKPASFVPSYRPASGDPVEIWVLWTDQEGKRHKVRAQEWLRNVKTREAMKFNWVFAGSSFYTDPNTGQKYYQGDGGDFVCVSNFPTATLDLPIESSQSDEALLFEAFTENMPPVETKVQLVFVPGKKDQPGEKKDASPEKP
jgi:hypothetical protein